MGMLTARVVRYMYCTVDLVHYNGVKDRGCDADVQRGIEGETESAGGEIDGFMGEYDVYL